MKNLKRLVFTCISCLGVFPVCAADSEKSITQIPSPFVLNKERLLSTSTALAYARELSDNGDSAAITGFDQLTLLQEACNAVAQRSNQNIFYATSHFSVGDHIVGRPVFSAYGRYAAMFLRKSQYLYVHDRQERRGKLIAASSEFFDFSSNNHLIISSGGLLGKINCVCESFWTQKGVPIDLFNKKDGISPERERYAVDESDLVALAAHKTELFVAKAYLPRLASQTYIAIQKLTREHSIDTENYKTYSTDQAMLCAEHMVPGPLAPNGLKWHPFEKLLAVQTLQGIIRLFDMRMQQTTCIDISDVSPFHNFDFDGAGNRICMANQRRKIAIFDIAQRTINEIDAYECIQPGCIQNVCNDIFAITGKCKVPCKWPVQIVDINALYSTGEKLTYTGIDMPAGLGICRAIIALKKTGQLSFLYQDNNAKTITIACTTFAPQLGTTISEPEPSNVAVLYAASRAQNNEDLLLLRALENQRVVRATEAKDSIFKAYMDGYVGLITHDEKKQ